MESEKCCIFAPRKAATSAASRHSSIELGSALNLHEVCQSNITKTYMKQSTTYPESSPQMYRAPLTKAAKPFIKWVGGKGQLIDQLDAYLPEEFGERRNITYIEPFVGESLE